MCFIIALLIYKSNTADENAYIIVTQKHAVLQTS